MTHFQSDLRVSSGMSTSHTFVTTLLLASDRSNATAIPVPLNPRETFGKARAPVVVSINGYSYRSTICNMGDGDFLPLAKVHRDAAGVAAGQRIKVALTLDDAPRTVTPPKDLAAALKAAGLIDGFKAMSFTHQKEHVAAVQEAKKPETRARRIAACVQMVQAREASRAQKASAKASAAAAGKAPRASSKKKVSQARPRARTRG